MWRFSAFLLLLLLAIQHIRGADVEPPPEYKGPVVCQGTKPLIIHENYANILKDDEHKKQYYEQYWYQIYTHLLGCEIIVGNLIIPHQHNVPFETARLNEAIEKIEIVTGYIYIFDVGLDLNFKSLKMVQGNELFYYPDTWSDFDKTSVRFIQGYAIFVEKFTAKTLSMPELRYIKNGFIGFKETPHACVWKQEFGVIDFNQIFDGTATERVFGLGPGVFTQCGAGGNQYKCSISGCANCYVDALSSSSSKTCQKPTKVSCDCKNVEDVSPDFCSAPGHGACCPKHSQGGCYGNKNHAVFCKDGYYLNIPKDAAEQRTCKLKCLGKVIDGTNICLDDSDECPDYMFPYGDHPKKCVYRCPFGQEMDPIGNIDGLEDPERIEPKFLLYWGGKNRCKPCRMKFDNDKKDFVNDCGISCVIQSNSLSFVTILNIYPAITEIKDYDFQTFKNVFTKEGIINLTSHIFKEKCRHIYGFLHIDQYSVGYPGDSVRLIPEHFRLLTYATGLYGNIRIENTEGYWFAEPFRNLLVMQKPMKGKIAYDQKQFEEYGVRVQYNSDLRTVDLQRLHYMHGNIEVRYNPLYIPPRKKINETHVYDVFAHVKKGTGYKEFVSENGLDTTRTGKKITYDAGCTDGEVAFYYRRCVKCAQNEYRWFDEKARIKKADVKELFAKCKSYCNTDGKIKVEPDGTIVISEYKLTRDGEKQCLECSPQCPKCTDHTPFTCYSDDPNILDCRGHVINEFNIHACAPVTLIVDDKLVGLHENGKVKDENNKVCLNGFAKEAIEKDAKNGNGKCLRCDSACRQCHDNAKDDNGNLIYAVPGTTLNKGCKGCGFVFLAKQNNGNWIGVCGNLGAAPRYPFGMKNVHHLINNPVRRLFNNIKPSKFWQPTSSAELDYGEA